ncbi:MarR family transcriptional regulator [bacterium]|nr:MarR family transcriptional regulator [bacterium]
MKKSKSKAPDINELVREVADIPLMMFTRIRFAMFDRGELTPPLVSALMMLRDMPDGLRMSDIAKRISSTMPTTTGIVNRLVERDLVVRGDDPNDRRVVTVKLTEKGKKAGAEFEKHVQNVWRPVVVGLNNEEKKQFLVLIRKIKTLISEEAKK